MSLTIFVVILIGLCLAALVMSLFCEVESDDAIEEIIREEKANRIQYFAVPDQGTKENA